MGREQRGGRDREREREEGREVGREIKKRKRNRERWRGCGIEKENDTKKEIGK